MSFFKKEETGLFIAENGGRPADTASPYFEKDAMAVEDLDRFNEVETPSKRRRLSGEADAAHDQEGNGSLFGDDEEATTSAPSAATVTATKSGPFMEDSDSEDDEEEHPEAIIGFDRGPPSDDSVVAFAAPEACDAAQEKETAPQVPDVDLEPLAKKEPPTLIKEETSYGGGVADFQDFEGVEGDFDEDINEEGDETFERRYMEEQARLEAEAAGQDYDRREHHQSRIL
jgi:DNA cross-link repair 1A protein